MEVGIGNAEGGRLEVGIGNAEGGSWKLELGPAVVLNERDYGAAVDAGSGLSKLIGSLYEPEGGMEVLRSEPV